MKKMLIINLIFTSLMFFNMKQKSPDVESEYYYYGYYPQSVVDDDIIYDDLYFISEMKSPDFLNWYHYGDNYYACLETSNIHDERTFHNGQKILNNRKYFFKCEKVEWKVYRYSDHFGMQATKILDLQSYYLEATYEYESVFSNSLIYAYLDNYVVASLEKMETTPLSSIMLNHSSIYLDNIDDTKFKVNLPVFENSLDENSNLVRECSDYALAKGIDFVLKDDKCVANYWTSQMGSSRSKMIYVTTEGETFYNANINEVFGISPYVEIKRR